ncbi:hypothetical protein ACFL54_07785, partial [Planctomycetota bacterium]
DDIFIYSNKSEHTEYILKTYQEELESYKLFINEAKTVSYSRPFMSQLSMANTSLKKIIDSFFSSYIESVETNQDKKRKALTWILVKGPHEQAITCIKDIKTIVKRHGVSYSSMSSHLLIQIAKTLVHFRKGYTYEPHSKSRLVGWLRNLIDIAFFIYAMDTRVNTTYKIAKIINEIKCLCDDIGDEEMRFHHSKQIYDLSLFSIQKELRQSEISLVEIMNLVLVLKTLGSEFQLPKKIVSQFYKSIITLILYMEGIKEYDDTQNKLHVFLKRKFESNEMSFSHCEDFMLFFDILSCPYIPEGFRREICAKTRLWEHNVKTSEKNSAFDYISTTNWFTDWHTIANFGDRLAKNEYKTPY